MGADSGAGQARRSGTARKRGRGADPAETRRALTEAAFESVRTLGLRGTTARSIARLAGCNQAAIYYHFDGIEQLLIRALQESSDRRLTRYRAVLADDVPLLALVDRLAELYEEDRATGHLEVLAELMGGITATPELRPGIDEATEPWLRFVEDRIRTVAETVPYGRSVPAEDLADLVFSVIIGLELRNKVDGNTERSTRLFRLAALVASLVPEPAADGSPATT